MKCKHGVISACALCMEATKRRKEFEAMKQAIEELKRRVEALESAKVKP